MLAPDFCYKYRPRARERRSGPRISFFAAAGKAPYTESHISHFEEYNFSSKVFIYQENSFHIPTTTSHLGAARLRTHFVRWLGMDVAEDEVHSINLLFVVPPLKMKLAIASLLVGSAAAFAPAQQAFRAPTSLQATATDAKVRRNERKRRTRFRWREESQLLPRMFREGMEIRRSMAL